MSKEKKKNILKPTSGDVAHTIVKGAISGAPVIGPVAAELFSLYIAPPISKRINNWLESLHERLKKLENIFDNFKIENLSKNESFITTITNASQIAIRNHQKEKLEALRNAVLNSALPNPPEDDLQLIFLNLVDSFTQWHLRILIFFSKEYNKNFKKTGTITPSENRGWVEHFGPILEIEFPELKGKKDLYNKILEDFLNQGLMERKIDQYKYHTNVFKKPLLTGLGNQFLDFITSPIEGLNKENEQ